MAASTTGWECASTTDDALFPWGNMADSLARSWAWAALTRRVEDAGTVPLGCVNSPAFSASEPVAPAENEHEGLEDVCLTLPTAATEWRG